MMGEGCEGVQKRVAKTRKNQGQVEAAFKGVQWRGCRNGLCGGAPEVELALHAFSDFLVALQQLHQISAAVNPDLPFCNIFQGVHQQLQRSVG